jgi:hypothetical protein
MYLAIINVYSLISAFASARHCHRSAYGDRLEIDPEGSGFSRKPVTSFLLFAAGAIIPVIPLYSCGTTAVMSSAALSAVGPRHRVGHNLFPEDRLYSGIRRCFRSCHGGSEISSQASDWRELIRVSNKRNKVALISSDYGYSIIL